MHIVEYELNTRPVNDAFLQNMSTSNIVRFGSHLHWSILNFMVKVLVRGWDFLIQASSLGH